MSDQDADDDEDRPEYDPVLDPEIIELAAQVEAEGQVDLGAFDDAELLAVGIRPMGRPRVEHAWWPGYLGMPRDGAGTWPPAVADHPEVQAGGRRLAARGLAVAIRRNDLAPAGWGPVGPARLYKLLYDGGSHGALIWFSGSLMTATKKLSPVSFNGGMNFCWLGPRMDGLCLIQSLTIRDEPDPATPLITKVTVARPEIAARHIVQAVYREPLTDQERDTTYITHCKVLIAVGKERKPWPFDFWHLWGEPIIFRLRAGSRPPRRRFLRSRRGMLHTEAVTDLFTSITTGIVRDSRESSTMSESSEPG